MMKALNWLKQICSRSLDKKIKGIDMRQNEERKERSQVLRIGKTMDYFQKKVL